MYSAPSAELRFSAAIEGSFIQSCNRFTDSSCRFVTSALIGARSSAAWAENAVPSAMTIINERRWYVLIEYLSPVTQPLQAQRRGRAFKGHKGSHGIFYLSFPNSVWE